MVTVYALVVLMTSCYCRVMFEVWVLPVVLIYRSASVLLGLGCIRYYVLLGLTMCIFLARLIRRFRVVVRIVCTMVVPLD